MIKNASPTESRVHHVYHRYGLDTPTLADPPSAPVRGAILVVDPGDTGYLVPLRLMLPDCRLFLCRGGDEARELFFNTAFDAVLIDHSPLSSALDLLRLFKTSRPSVPLLVMTEQGSEALAVEAFRSGARDYFHKPLPLDDVECTLRAMLTLRNHPLKVRASAPPKDGFAKALQYIQTHFNTPLSLTLVAGKSGMSLSSFVRLFKKRTGMTFIDYVHGIRMAAACRLLRDPDLSLLRISLACGYNNQSHFNRVFKKFVGVAPGVYKKNLTRHPLP